MSILFATPMYGGQCTEQYFSSCMALKDQLVRAGVEHAWLTGINESLITRARNGMVASFMKTEFQSLMFIDADIQFEPEDVGKLWNMNADVAVGVYAMKKPDAAWYAAWVDGKLMKELPDKPMDVDFAGTGFMMIKREVIQRMIEAYPETKHESNEGTCHALFDTAVLDDTYYSEDYLFCRRFREIGGAITMDPTVKLKHIGSYVYG